MYECTKTFEIKPPAYSGCGSMLVHKGTLWTEWVQVCTQLKKYPDAVNNIRIVTDNERLKRSEWNHKKQLENEVTKRNR